MSTFVQISSVECSEAARCLNIHLKIQVDYRKDVQCKAVVYFYFDTGTGTNSPIGGVAPYKDAGGYLCAHSDFKPIYENCVYNDFVVSIPYDKLNLSLGTHYQLKVLANIFESQSSQWLSLGTSNYHHFSFFNPQRSNSIGLISQILLGIGGLVVIALFIGIPVQIIIAIPVVGIGTILFTLNMGQS